MVQQQLYIKESHVFNVGWMRGTPHMIIPSLHLRTHAMKGNLSPRSFIIIYHYCQVKSSKKPSCKELCIRDAGIPYQKMPCVCMQLDFAFHEDNVLGVPPYLTF